MSQYGTRAQFFVILLYLFIEILLSIISAHVSDRAFFYLLFVIDIGFAYIAYKVMFKPISRARKDEKGEVSKHTVFLYHAVTFFVNYFFFLPKYFP